MMDARCHSVLLDLITGWSEFEKNAAKIAGSPDPPHSAGWFQADELRGQRSPCLKRFSCVLEL
jgi:hypothetical protein